MSLESVSGDTQLLTDEIIGGIKDSLKSRGAYEPICGYAPTRSLAAVRMAGSHLRHFPGEPLADSPVRYAEYHDDTAIKTLETMVNESINGSQSDEERPVFSCTDPRPEESCRDAERYFMTGLRDLFRHPKLLYSGDIVASRNKPTLLIKNTGMRTCLTLCEITIDGVSYPAGSIAVPKIEPEAFNDAGHDMRDAGRNYRLLDVHDVISLGFLRLSRFALTPREQRLVNWQTDTDNFKERMQLRTMTAQKIGKTVKKILHRDGLAD